MIVIRRFAPAKLNLTLEIVGKRADGYHLLDSLVAFADYGDTITASPSDQLSLTIDGPFAVGLSPTDDQNLVLRAARKLAAAAGRPCGARISLTKRLPIASGIGGGSSDAAATLSALCELWQVTLCKSDLDQIALSLGADVPVCLAGHPARLEGIGDIVTAAPPVPPAAIVLVNPGQGLSTPSVFKTRAGAFSPRREAGILRRTPADASDLAATLAPYGNDLTEPAVRLLPVIGEILNALQTMAGCLTARMSGSGATCFALFSSDAEAETAGDSLRKYDSSWWVVATHLRAM